MKIKQLLIFFSLMHVYSLFSISLRSPINFFYACGSMYASSDTLSFKTKMYIKEQLSKLENNQLEDICLRRLAFPCGNSFNGHILCCHNYIFIDEAFFNQLTDEEKQFMITYAHVKKKNHDADKESLLLTASATALLASTMRHYWLSQQVLSTNFLDDLTGRSSLRCDERKRKLLHLRAIQALSGIAMASWPFYIYSHQCEATKQAITLIGNDTGAQALSRRLEHENASLSYIHRGLSKIMTFVINPSSVAFPVMVIAALHVMSELSPN